MKFIVSLYYSKIFFLLLLGMSFFYFHSINLIDLFLDFTHHNYYMNIPNEDLLREKGDYNLFLFIFFVFIVLFSFIRLLQFMKPVVLVIFLLSLIISPLFIFFILFFNRQFDIFKQAFILIVSVFLFKFFIVIIFQDVLNDFYKTNYYRYYDQHNILTSFGDFCYHTEASYHIDNYFSIIKKDCYFNQYSDENLSPEYAYTLGIFYGMMVDYSNYSKFYLLDSDLIEDKINFYQKSYQGVERLYKYHQSSDETEKYRGTNFYLTYQTMGVLLDVESDIYEQSYVMESYNFVEYVRDNAVMNSNYILSEAFLRFFDTEPHKETVSYEKIESLYDNYSQENTRPLNTQNITFDFYVNGLLTLVLSHVIN